MPNPEIAPALVERAIALVRQIATERNAFEPKSPGTWFGLSTPLGDEARSIVAELPAPVDPDLLLAREVAVAYFRKEGMLDTAGLIEDGDADDDDGVECALQAIKRVRQQEKG